MLKNPEIAKSFVCSTAHISEEDNNKLLKLLKEKTSPSSSLPTYDYEYGYRIFIGENLEDTIAEFKLANLSDELCHLLKVANYFECQWLVLDDEGTVYEELPKFNW